MRVVPKAKPNPDQYPLQIIVPETTWTVPTSIPDLVGQGVKTVAIDCETKDDGLAAKRGPSWPDGRGYVCGVSLAWQGGSTYLPIRHPETECLDRNQVRGLIQDLVNSGVHLITQNGPYDWGWLGTDLGVTPPVAPEDTLAGAVMLDENQQSYSLGAICARLGIPGKDRRALEDAGRAYGLSELMSELWRLPARFVGAYAEQDAVATFEAWKLQKPQLTSQGLEDAYRLECDLIPMIVAMRRKGIRVDLDSADRAKHELLNLRNVALAEISDKVKVGRDVTIEDVQSPKFLETAFSEAGVSFQKTEKTERGSFSRDWMQDHPHWLPRAVSQARRCQMAADKFIDNFILSFTTRGRIHAEMHALRNDDGGTRSYRFSYSDPPLQQMPSPKRDKLVGNLVRRCFVPEPGEQWAKCDWSQQEIRLAVHFAAVMNLERAREAAAMFRENPETDFHRLVMDWTGLSRPNAKDTSFAKIYGAGIPKFASMIGQSKEEAKKIYEQYDRELPFMQGLYKEASKAANTRGYIKLIDGARCRFDLWEPGWGYDGPWLGAVGLEEARQRITTEGHEWYGVKLKRAFTHKAMNRLVQGSAARQCKLAMRILWLEGIVPLLQLHDELDVSFSDPRIPVRVKEVMETAVNLQVPMLADSEVGPSWGETS